MKHSFFSLFFSSLAVVWLALGGSLGKAHAARKDQRCVSWFKQKSFLQAARCFEQLAAKMGPGNRLPESKRFLKGQRLRNAALALQKAATLTNQPRQAAYLREKAVLLLRGYRKEKLCETAYRCQSAYKLEKQLYQEIRYAKLTVVTENPAAQISIKGYHLHKQTRGTWNQEIRPGWYTVTVLYPQQKKPVARRFRLAPNQKQRIVIAPPKDRTPLRRTPATRLVRRRPPPPSPPNFLPWVVAGAGALVAVGGGILLALAHQRRTQQNQLIAEAKKNPNRAPEAWKEIEYRELPETLITTGRVLLGVGGAVALTGLLWFLLQPPSTPSPTPQH